jgi:hypothetical protein
MAKKFSLWKAMFGAAVVPGAYAFLKKAVPIGKCAAEKCLTDNNRWAAMVATLLTATMILAALWLRGSSEKRKAIRSEQRATDALERAKATQEDALTIVDAFNVRVIRGKTEFGHSHSLQYSDDIAVAAAVKRIRKAR